MKGNSKSGKSERPKAIPPFHERFDIAFDISQARERFVNRICNIIPAVVNRVRVSDRRLFWKLADRLGLVYNEVDDYLDYIPKDFYVCLELLEATYDILTSSGRGELEEELKRIISQSGVDLGIIWRNGHFWRSGAKLLDEHLVNEPFSWLSPPQYKDVRIPFEKGLREFLEAKANPEKLTNGIRDMYIALEKMARIVLGNNRNLKANAEKFTNRLGLSTYYGDMLKKHSNYVHDFRHAVEDGSQQMTPSPQEVEAFVYTTGMFLRLSVEMLDY